MPEHARPQQPNFNPSQFHAIKNFDFGLFIAKTNHKTFTKLQKRYFVGNSEHFAQNTGEMKVLKKTYLRHFATMTAPSL